jgi:hypothetical protein
VAGGGGTEELGCDGRWSGEGWTAAAGCREGQSGCSEEKKKIRREEKKKKKKKKNKEAEEEE